MATKKSFLDDLSAQDENPASAFIDVPKDTPDAMADATLKDHLTLEQAAKALKMGVKTTREYFKSGKIKGAILKASGRGRSKWFIHKDRVTDYLKGL